MNKKLSTTIIVIIIIVGLGLILYPTLSDILKSIAYHNAIVEYNATVSAMDDSTYEELLASAKEYNAKLLEQGGSIRVTLSDAEIAEYESQLNIDNSGIMGYIVIQRINVSLPIYHGTSEAVLQSGIGHLEGTSLPVGGEGTHSVLSGHRGLPSAMLFTNIDQLVIGDTFTVRVLREVLTYEVDDIQVVLPHQLNAIRIEEGKDYCTLLTCTPYGVNSHRLLVRGHRIPTPVEEMESDGLESQSWMDYLPWIIGGVIAIIVIVIVIVVIVIRRRKRKAKTQENS